MAIDKIFDGAVDGIADNLFNSVSNSVSEIKAMQQRKAAENVQLVVQSLKKIDADIRDKFDGVTTTLETRIANIKDGRDGIDGKNGRDGLNGKDGRDGKDGRNGRDGATGPRGFDGPKGLDGKDGKDGEDGVSVEDAHIDFDGSLIITLSSGRVINVGEVVAADIAEKIKVITNGGGTSQTVLDELASLQAQIDLISSALVYKGTWNANTNSPTLASSTGTANTFYIVSVAGATDLNGVTNWGVGDWAVYNGSTWQRIEGGAVGNFTDLSVSGTTTLSGLTASTALALNASKAIVSVTNTGTGNNVLATSPTLTTPNLGTPSAITLTNATSLPLSTGITGTLPIGNGGTGQTTAANAFTALAPSQTGNTGKYLTTNGTSASWATVSAGVTSVAATVPSFLSVSGSPITSSGTLAFTLSGTALPTTSGGTGLTSFTNKGVPYASSTSSLTTGTALQFDGTNFGVGATPSAWGSTFRAIEVGDQASLSYESNGSTKRSSFATNIYNATTIGARPYYKANGLATEYYQNVGEHVWSTAPSGISGPTTTITSGNTYTTLSSGNQTAFGAANNSVGTIWGATSSGTLSSGTVIQNVDFVEAMRIDTSANVGIGTSTPGSKLDVKGTLRLSGSTSGYVGLKGATAAGSTTYTLPSADGSSGQALVTNGSGTLSWASTSSGTVTSVAASVPSFLSVSGSPITSSGTLAISLSGTALPTSSGGTGLTSFTSSGVAYASSSSALATGSSLQFDGTNLLVGTTTSTYNYSGRTCLELNGSTDSLIAFKSAGTATGYIQGASATFNMYAVGSSIPMVFGVNGSERARIDTSGNFGLGVTPSSWGSSYKSLEIGGVVSYLSSANQYFGMYANAYRNSAGTLIYTTSGVSSGYLQDLGSHKWFNAPSGTAGLTTTITNGQSYTTVTSGNQTSFGAPNNTVGTIWTATSGGTLSSGTVTQNITFTQAMTLDASGQLGIGTSSPSYKLDVVGSATNVAKFQNGSNQSVFIASVSGLSGILSESSNQNGWLMNSSSNYVVAYTNGSEKMRLDSSGNLLVGTSTAGSGSLLTVAGGIQGTDYRQTGTGYITWNTSAGSNSLIFRDNANERMRIDASGNFGFGTTLINGYYGSSSVSTRGVFAYTSSSTNYDTAPKGLVIRNDDTTTGNFSQLVFGSLNTGNTPIASASIWSINDARSSGFSTGSLAFGTVGGSGVISERMRIDSSGNLGIGTISPLAKLDVASANTATDSIGNAFIRTTDTQAADVGGKLTLGGLYNGSSYYAFGGIAGKKENSTSNNVAGYLQFLTTSSGGTLAERMRLDSSGNLGLGVTPSAWGSSRSAMQLNARMAIWGDTTQTLIGNNIYGAASGDKYIATAAASLYAQNAGAHSWYNAPSGTAGNAITFTQAMTLDASGNLLVGTTSVLTGFTATRATFVGTTGFVAQTNSNNAGFECGAFWHPATSGNNTFAIFGTETTYTTRGSVTYNRAGGLTMYNTTSDYRAKDISGPVIGSGALIDSVPVYMGKMKGATQERPMFIAHETPVYAHTGEKDAVDAEGNPVYQQMDASALVPVMWAEIQSLRKRLADAGIA